MKKVILVLMLLPLFVGCNNDDDKVEKAKEDTAWKEKTYNIRIEFNNDIPYTVHYYDEKSEDREGETDLNDGKRKYMEYKIKPRVEEVSFVTCKGNVGNQYKNKLTAKLFIDDKFITSGTGVYNERYDCDMVNITYNFKTKKVKVSSKSRL